MQHSDHGVESGRSVSKRGDFYSAAGGFESESLDRSERRKFERAGLSRDGMLAEIDSDGRPGLEVACETVDISRAGLGVLCKRMVAPGRMVRVTVVGPRGVTSSLVGIVRACRYMSNGMHLVGIEFQVVNRTSGGQAA